MIKLYPYQTEDLQAIESFDGRCLYAADMGLGKSAVSLHYLYNHPEIKLAVVVCPASLKWNWKREAWVHFGMRSHVLEGRKPTNKQLKHRLVVINYDILKDWEEYLTRLKPDLLIPDECHALGNKNSKRTRSFKRLASKVQHIIPLSGTPLVNRPLELWPVLNILWRATFSSFFDYGQTYCGPKRGFWGGWDYSGSSNLPQLHSTLKKCGLIRRLKKDVLSQLPPKTLTVVPLDISNRREYEAAENDFIKWLKSISPGKARRAKKAIGITKLNYMKQLAEELKLERVCDWVDDFLKGTEEKLILFAVHKKIINALMERYSKVAVKVDGSVTGQNRQKAFDTFNHSKKIRLFVGNIKAAGVGWSCKSASTVCFVELSWVSGDHLQAEDRISGLNRGVKGRGANIVYLVGKGTVEESLCKILQRKQRIISSVLDGRKTTKLDVYTELCKALGRKSNV